VARLWHPKGSPFPKAPKGLVQAPLSANVQVTMLLTHETLWAVCFVI